MGRKAHLTQYTGLYRGEWAFDRIKTWQNVFPLISMCQAFSILSTVIS